MPPKLTTEHFITKARAVHGNKYDYSRVEYVTATCKVLISCIKHGAFQQVPFVHLRGSGCPTCGRRASVTTAFFIERATAVHGARYDYSRAEYTTTKQPVTIGCAVHGFFRQAAADHVKGSGCPACGALARIAGKTKTTAWFVERARAVHGECYSYELAVYSANDQELIIECAAHGKKDPC